MTENTRTAAQQRGDRAENLACDYLRQQNLSLIERNFRCRYGEIDLIMRDGSYTVFIEVRARSKSTFADAAESIDARKQRKIIAASQAYLQKNPSARHGPVRIDVVTLDSTAANTRVQWLKDAIQAN